MVMDRLLNGPDRDWFTESAKKPMAELASFFKDRLYDPCLEQGIGTPYRRQEAVMNNLYLGKKPLLESGGFYFAQPATDHPFRRRAGSLDAA
jgi:hypothetical protein